MMRKDRMETVLFSAVDVVHLKVGCLSITSKIGMRVLVSDNNRKENMVSQNGIKGKDKSDALTFFRLVLT